MDEVDLIDRIYEAAFLPELWPEIMDFLAARTQSRASVILVATWGGPMRCICTAEQRQAMPAFVADPEIQRLTFEWRHAGRTFPEFVRDVDAFPHVRSEIDPIQQWLRKFGLGWQLATTIQVPSGETAIFEVDRRYEDGPHDETMPRYLNRFRPHLARAALIGTRLGLERARTAVATLEMFGLPAAVLSGSGRVMAANHLLESSPEFVDGAFGRLILCDASANKLFAEMLAARGRRLSACSLPIARTEGRPPAIVHVMPLQGVTNDLFGGDMMVVLTALREDANVPDTTLLHGLFDLTPSEARIAAALAAGLTLKEAAEAAGIRTSTARSYIESVLGKTGAKQQSQLVALLKGTILSTPQSG